MKANVMPASQNRDSQAGSDSVLQNPGRFDSAPLDVVCVGTSPRMLIEGLEIASRGRSVVFIDRSNHIGGGWGTCDLFGLRKVETGVHLFENRTQLNAEICGLIGESAILTSKSEDFGVFCNRRIPMSTARVLMYGGLLAKATLRRRLDEAEHSLKQFFASLFNMRVPFIYPIGGVGALLDGLHDRLASNGAKFVFGSQVELVDTRPSGLSVKVNGVWRSAAHVVMASRAHAPIVGLEHHLNGLRTSRVRSIVLLVNERSSAFGGYVEILGRRTLKRVRNLTRYYPELRSGSLLIAQTRLNAFGDQVSEVDLVNALVEIGLLSRSTKVRESAIFDFHFKTLPRRYSRLVARRHGEHVTILDTVDFSNVRSKGRWEETDKNRGARYVPRR